MTWMEIESDASWANAPGNGNANRTARMLMNRFFVFMMYRLSLFSGNFSRALQKTCGSSDFAGPWAAIIAHDLSPIATPIAGIHDIVLIVRLCCSRDR